MPSTYVLGNLEMVYAVNEVLRLKFVESCETGRFSGKRPVRRKNSGAYDLSITREERKTSSLREFLGILHITCSQRVMTAWGCVRLRNRPENGRNATYFWHTCRPGPRCVQSTPLERLTPSLQQSECVFAKIVVELLGFMGTSFLLFLYRLSQWTTPKK